MGTCLPTLPAWPFPGLLALGTGLPAPPLPEYPHLSRRRAPTLNAPAPQAKRGPTMRWDSGSWNTGAHSLSVGGRGRGLGRQAGAGLGLQSLPGHCGVSRLYSKTHTAVTGVVKWDVQSGVCLVCVCMCEACACALEHTHACVHVCALCMCICTHACACTCMCVHMSVIVCACMYVRIHGHAVCAHTCAQVCVHACACLCVRVCAWAYVCMCRGQRASKWVPSALVPEFKGRHSMWGVIGEGFPEAAGPGGRGQRGIHRRHAAQQS